MNNYSQSPSLPGNICAGVLGYSGYSGAELVGLLEQHLGVETVLLDHRKADDGSSDKRPVRVRVAQDKLLPHIPWTRNVLADNKIDVLFLATPHEVSLELVPESLEQGAKVIDLSGAFRLSAQQFEKWYVDKHTSPELLKEAVYGLPELNREKIRTARLVANPGCYPTAATCAIAPLVRQDWIDQSAGIICDAKSGVSGAGKKPTAKTHFIQVNENFSAYGILKHRHVPEVLNNTGLDEQNFSFTAQLLPIERGIMASNYFRLKRAVSMEEVFDVYRNAYRDSHFIRLYPEGSQPELRQVNYTNFCDIHCTLGGDGKRLVVISCIDNLVKGAAGQAVQNMNLMFGFDETAALL